MIERLDGEQLTDSRELFFEFDKSVEIPADEDCDVYLLSVLMEAMQESRDLIIQGKVSLELLSNLTEFQAAWAAWLPQTYSVVQIKVDEIVKAGTPTKGAICAYSGGVDATFSVWRHTQKRFSYRSQEIKACVLVHGFDIPLAHDDEFSSVYQANQRTLADLDLRLIAIRTNYREVIGVEWEHVSGCALVAALANLKFLAGTCIVGSSEPYTALVIPWGSSPITDHLLSSSDFKVQHDGAEKTRTAKVAEIADWSVGIANLRVCWEGAKKDGNCGHCEKCVRTRLNFLATGNSEPSCFPVSDICEDIKNTKLKSTLQRQEWKALYEHALAHGVKGKWLPLVRAKYTRVSMAERIQPFLNNNESLIDKLFPKGGKLRGALMNIRDFLR